MLEMLVVRPEDLVKLLAALVIGGLVGAEREYHDKAAGLRTLILICMGSTLFTLFSVQIAGDKDPGRVAAQVVTGIGFLGAGVILYERGRVRGLTTASTIWFTAALGIGVGVGEIFFSVIAMVLALFILRVLPRIESQMERAMMFRDYQVTTDISVDKPLELAKTFREAGLAIKHDRTTKRDGRLVTAWLASGKAEAHAAVIARLIADPDVKELEY